MNIRLSKADLEEIVLWGNAYQDTALGVGVPFESDENALLSRLRAMRKHNLLLELKLTSTAIKEDTKDG